MKKILNNSLIGLGIAILIGILLSFLFGSKFIKQSKPSKKAQYEIDSLKNVLEKVTFSLALTKSEARRLDKSVLSLKDSVKKEKRGRVKAQNALNSLRRKFYSEQQLDSLLAARYPSFANQDSLFNIPLQTGRDVANDLVEFDATKTAMIAMDKELIKYEDLQVVQDSLQRSRLKQDSIRDVQEAAFKAQVLNLNNDANTWKQAAEDERKNFKKARNQRNISIAVNILQFVLMALK